MPFFTGSQLADSGAPTDKSTDSQAAARQTSDSNASAAELDLAQALESAEDALPTVSIEELRSTIAAALANPELTPKSEENLKAMLVQLAQSNPQEALELASQITSLRAQESARVAILETWARTDPMAALSWAESALQDETASVRSAQLEAIYRGYAMENPQAALQLASQLATNTSAERRYKSRIMSEIIETQIRNGDLEGAKLTIEQMEDGDIKTDLAREMVSEWARYDPAAAAEYVNSLGPDVDARIKSTLIDRWAESDPAAAAAWLSTLPEDDPSISRAASDLVREWARYDLTASAEWLNSLPASPELDRAVASYTFRAAQEDPASAMTWAESVTNERMQGYLTQRVAAEWKETDPEAFQAYLDNSDYSEEEKTKLMNSNRWGSGRGPGGGRPR